MQFNQEVCKNTHEILILFGEYINGGEMMLHMIFIILWIILFISWLVWFIGYPIYKKLIKKKIFDWCWYAIWLNVGALGINVCNLLIKITK